MGVLYLVLGGTVLGRRFWTLPIGRLTASQLGLQVQLHDPDEHYRAVKDKWIGLRTPDGR